MRLSDHPKTPAERLDVIEADIRIIHHDINNIKTALEYLTMEIEAACGKPEE